MKALFVFISLYFSAAAAQGGVNFGFKAPDIDRFKRQASRVWRQHGLWRELGIPEFWNQYQNGPYGIVIRGWQFSRCASEQWTDYKVNVTDLTIWPKFPRFPGPMFFNITAIVKEPLPETNIEMETEVRHAVVTSTGQKGWQVIPCQGWNLLDGCDGVGSCRYCDVLDRCKKSVKTGYKYADTQKARQALSSPQKLCPPPVGKWHMSFSKVLKTADVPKGLFGPLQSNEYWFTFTFTDGRGTSLGCVRIWMDICKYHLYDRYQRCLRDPNAFKNFLTKISEHAKALRTQNSRTRPSGVRPLSSSSRYNPRTRTGTYMKNSRMSMLSRSRVPRPRPVGR